MQSIDKLNTQSIVNKIRLNSCCLKANLPCRLELVAMSSESINHKRQFHNSMHV